MIHLPRASPLHAARAAVGSVWCIAIAGVALSFEHPLVLTALLLSVLAAAAAAGVLRRVALGVALGLPIAIGWALINALVSRDGLTIVARLGEVPWLGGST